MTTSPENDRPVEGTGIPDPARLGEPTEAPPAGPQPAGAASEATRPATTSAAEALSPVTTAAPTTWRFVAVAIAGVVAGALAVALAGRPGAIRGAAVVAPATGPADAPPQPPPVIDSPAESVSGSKWMGARRPQRLRDGSRMVEFELRAENSVPVWRHRVHPILSVRCLSGVTDVFVRVGWAASVEEYADRHTVRLGFDDEGEILQQWIDSDDYKALFAPDGVALARRLARARTLRFGFTPFNASPTVVTFNVSGFDAVIQSVARTCRWKP